MTDGHRRFDIFTFISRPALNWTIYEVIPHFKAHEALLITQHQYLIDIKFGHPLKHLWWKQWVKPYKYELENQCFEHGSTVLFTGFLVLFWPFASFKKSVDRQNIQLGGDLSLGLDPLTHFKAIQVHFTTRIWSNKNVELFFEMSSQKWSFIPLMLLIFGATSTHYIRVKIVRRKHLNPIVVWGYLSNKSHTQGVKLESTTQKYTTFQNISLQIWFVLPRIKFHLITVILFSKNNICTLFEWLWK